MLTVPAATPVTIPVLPTVAVAVFALLHEPPVVVVLSAVVVPGHTFAVPVMVAGVRFTVTVADEEQPPTVYDILAVPAVTPVTTPVEEPTLATDGAPLLHVPPVVAQLTVRVVPVQIVPAPVTAAGCAFTVTVLTL
jgi:hypothetical protein